MPICTCCVETIGWFDRTIHPREAVDETKMERRLLGEYFKGPCFYFHGQFKATWNESVQNILGKAQSPADWCKAFSLAHVQMGSRSINESRMWRH